MYHIKKSLGIKKYSTIIIIIVLFFTIIANGSAFKKNQFNIIYVDDDGIADYKNIQNAIDNASKSDMIFVFNGLYNGTINVNKKIDLIGENPTKTIIDGLYNNIVVNISKPFVKFSNFTVRNSNGYIGDTGIKINENNTLVKNCIFYNTKTGITINKCSENVIDNCSLEKNGEGIFIYKSKINIIKGCNINHNSIGINIDGGNNNNIFYSYFHNNGISYYINNSKQSKIKMCNISDNSANLGGIFILKSKEITINNSIINHNGAGLCIYSSKNIKILNCDISFNTHFGISLRTPSENILIKKSNLINGYRYGLYIEENNKCKLENCNIYNNYISSVDLKNSNLDAKNNYWGSKLGPSIFSSKRSSKVTWLPFFTKYYPWSEKKYENIGANWKKNKDYMDGYKFEIPKIKINLSGIDTDNDGLPDWWEEEYNYNKDSWDDHQNLDPDDDALNNFEECYAYDWSADPYKKDIFLEIDWMPCNQPEEKNKPQQNLIEEIIDIFAEQDINLHVDLGDMGGGGEIPYCKSNFSFSKLRDLYWTYFLNNEINNPRKGIFHYGVICSYCPDLNFPFFGWDSLDSFAISSEWLKEIISFFPRERLIAGATVHHLGHTLGLIADTYSGIDNMGTSNLFNKDFWIYKNYKSCMNYRYKYWIFSYSNGSHGKRDFDDWSNLNFEFFKNTDFKK